MTKRLRSYEKQAKRFSLFPSNFDVMDVNNETKERMKAKSSLRHDWRYNGTGN